MDQEVCILLGVVLVLSVVVGHEVVVEVVIAPHSYEEDALG